MRATHSSPIRSTRCLLLIVALAALPIGLALARQAAANNQADGAGYGVTFTNVARAAGLAHKTVRRTTCASILVWAKQQVVFIKEGAGQIKPAAQNAARQ